MRNNFDPQVSSYWFQRPTLKKSGVALVVTAVFVSVCILGQKAWQAKSKLNQIFSRLPSGNKGLLLSGVCFLGLTTIYTLYRWLSCKKVSFEPAEDLNENSKPDMRVEPLVPLLSLTWAMRLFKNFNPTLANKYENQGTLSNFLEVCLSSYPDSQEEARKKLIRLIAIQVEIEKVDADIEKIKLLYTEWLASETEEPFAFFSVKFKDSWEYILVEVSKSSPMSKEDLEGILTTAQKVVDQRKEDPYEQDVRDRSKEKSNVKEHIFFSKLHRFLGSDATTKKIYKIELLRKVLTDYPEWHEDPEFSAWVASSVVHLRKAIDTLNHGEESLSKALSFLKVTENRLLQLPAIRDNLSYLNANAVPLQDIQLKITKVMPYPGNQKIESQKGVMPFDAEDEIEGDFSVVDYPLYQSSEDLVKFGEFCSYFYSRYKSKGLVCKELESELTCFLLDIPYAKKAELFLKTLSESELEKLVRYLRELTQLELTLHLATRGFLFPPSRLLAVLRTLALMLDAVRKIPDTRFSEFTIDVKSFYQAFTDPYFDQGSYQHELVETLRYIKSQSTEAVDFWMIGESKGFMSDGSRKPYGANYLKGWYERSKTLKKGNFIKSDPATTSYLELWHKNQCRNLLDFAKACEEDFQGHILPRPVVDLRIATQLIEITANTDRLSFFEDVAWPRCVIRNKRNKEQVNFSCNVKDLIENRKVLEMIPTKRWLYSTQQTCSSLGGTFTGYAQWRLTLHELGTPVSSFYEWGGPVNVEQIRTRLATGMVATKSSSKVDLDGAERGENPKKHQRPEDSEYAHLCFHGLKQTQLNIHEDPFIFPDISLEASRDLQEMVSGRDNRAINALYTFHKHAYLLSQKPYAQEYQHVFRLMLFSGDFLTREIERNPEVLLLALGNIDGMLSIAEKLSDYKAWCFLYELHVDIIGTIPLDHPARNVRLEMHSIHTAKLNKFIDNSKDNIASFVQHGANLYIANFYGHAVLRTCMDDIFYLSRCYRSISSEVESLVINSPRRGQVLFDFGQEVCRKLSHQVKINGAQLLNQVLDGKERVWENVFERVYRAHNLVIDLRHGIQIFQDDCTQGLLPDYIRNNELFKELLGDKILSKSHKCLLVDTNLGQIWRVSINRRGIHYAIYYRMDRQFFLYRRKGENWEQNLRVTSEFQGLPADLKRGLIWHSVASDSIEIENFSGEKIYNLTIDNENVIKKLERRTRVSWETVLNPIHHTLFDKLTASEHWVATQTVEGKILVTYLDSNLQYQWNEEAQKWETAGDLNYFLTNSRLEDWISLDKQSGEETKTQFFYSAFRNYHILENSQGQARLVVAMRPYVRGFNRESREESKYSLALIPELENLSRSTKLTLCSFEIEKGKQLYSRCSEDFLYLAYLLFIQGKYTHAYLYLQRSQAIWSATKCHNLALRAQIVEWFAEWLDRSPNAVAFMTKMLIMQHRLLDSTFPPAATVIQNDTKLDLLIYVSNEYFNQEMKVDPFLRLNQQEIDDIRFFKSRISERKPLPDFINLTQDTLLKESLNAEIKRLEKTIPKMHKENPIEIAPYLPTALFDVSPWITPIKDEAGHRRVQERTLALAKELREIFVGNDLASQLGIGVADDIEQYYYKVEETFTMAQDAHMDQLLNILQQLEKQKLGQERFLRQRIVHLFNSPLVSTNQSIEQQLKEQETLYNSLFEKARHCFGTNNFEPLLSVQVVTTDTLPKLSITLRAYEVARTERQLLAKKRLMIDKVLKQPEDAMLREECARILQEWRQYDSDSHPYAHLLLVLEDELNISITSSQIKHINNFIKEKDVFIHEAIAGGKTTLLRIVFSAIASQKKGHLGGVVTYAPLMASHHQDYAQINNHAFGQAPCPLNFDRNTAHDAISIKLMLIYHLKAIQSGCLDQTPQAMISLNHTLTEMILCAVSQESLSDIESMQQLLNLRENRCEFYSDEMDKIFDPTTNFNYSFGGAVVIQRKYYQDALLLMGLLMENSNLIPFKEAICQNRLQSISNHEFEVYLRTLASEAFDKLGLPFDRETTLDYLTEVYQENLDRQKEILNFYQNVILAHENEEIIIRVQMLHSYIGVLLRGLKNKKVGTHFGRSGNGISVKPYSFSAVCLESSQRSFVPSTIMETCIDYLVNGVSQKGVNAYINSLKAKATAELRDTDLLDNTETGIKFQVAFGITLSSANEERYPMIACKINGSFPLLEECLMEILFREFKYYPEKIEGSSHDLNYHLSGASGSPERVNTLPTTIRRLSHLIRQKGAIGSVFYALLKDFNEEKDVIWIDTTKPIEDQVAQLLKPGDTFIDNVPFFSGKTGEEIVNDIEARASHLKSFRFLDERDEVSVRQEGRLSKGELGIDLRATVNIIPHKGRQGTNWTFALDTNGIIGIDVDSDLTSVLQSLGRLRLLGKGQRAMFLINPALKNHWEAIDHLQNRSLLGKIFWTLAQNEGQLLKPLHYLSNLKTIKSIRSQVLRNIKQTMKPTILVVLKQLKEFELTTVCPIDPTACGKPVQLEPSVDNLTNLLNREKSKLQKLKEAIQATHSIDFDTIRECGHIIDSGISKLDGSDLIMNIQDLPKMVSSSATSIDETEEMQIEVDERIEVEEDERIVQDDFVQQQIFLAAEDRLKEETANYPHPMSEIGMELRQFSEVLPIDEQYFPGISSSHFAFAIYNTHLGEQPLGNLWRERMWIYSEPERQNCFSTKVLVTLSKNGDLHLQMGSIKDSDLLFDEHLYQKMVDPNVDEQFFKMDLRETKIPEGLSPEKHDNWIKLMSLAKLLAVDCCYSSQEIVFLSSWLDNSPVPLKDLESRLGSYLERFYPNTTEHPVLKLIRKKLEQSDT